MGKVGGGGHILKSLQFLHFSCGKLLTDIQMKFHEDILLESRHNFMTMFEGK